jgi:hypothetical protein
VVLIDRGEFLVGSIIDFDSTKYIARTLEGPSRIIEGHSNSQVALLSFRTKLILLIRSIFVRYQIVSLNTGGCGTQ